MSDLAVLAPITLSIAAVERDTGLSKDTLRVWERRYGFPAPTRDPLGERAYPLEQIDKLRLVKRLLDAGHRPGRIVALPYGTLQTLSESTVDQPQRAGGPTSRGVDQQFFLALLRAHDDTALRGALGGQLMRMGVSQFLLEVAAPLTTAVGEAWIRGQIETFEEHLFREAMQVVLRQLIAALPAAAHAARPRVLLTTFPGESHGLGLLMAQALLTLEGCRCISLGLQTPQWDIVLAARAHAVDLVMLGFSASMNPNQIADGLAELRAKLPSAVGLWAGGAAPVLQRRPIGGVQVIGSLDDLGPELRRWREASERESAAAALP